MASVGFGVGETGDYVLEPATESSLSYGGTMSVLVICMCLWDLSDVRESICQ